jgi:hypothetical protein
VRQFFERFKNADGSLRGGFSEYETPQALRDRLRSDLRAYIHRRLAQEAGSASRTAIRALPPFGKISKALVQGRVIPFIGACAPCAGRPAALRWEPGKVPFLPSGVEISRRLAADADYPEHDSHEDLAKVASYYEAFLTRAALRERLRAFLSPAAVPALEIPAVYRLLADVPVPLLIVTTNFDVQIEQAFRETGRAYDLVVYPADRKDLANSVLWWPHGEELPRTPAPNSLDMDLATTTVIFKMHGSIHSGTDEWDSFVVTEEDHVAFLARVAAKSAIPPLFLTHLHDRSLLFIGCSLHDWNLRVVLRTLSRDFARRLAATDADDEIPSWAVNDELSELEVKLWQRRGVYPFQVGIDEFVAGLRQRMGA